MTTVKLNFVMALLLVPGVCAWAKGPIRELLDKNRVKDAVKMCRQVEVLSTKDQQVLIDCSWVFFQTNRPDSAKKLMEKIKADPSNDEYQLLEAFSLIKRKKYALAREITHKIHSKNGGNPIGVRAQELTATLFEQKGSLDAAAFIYKQLVSDHPDLGKAQWGLGRYYLSRGDLVRAEKHLRMTAKLWPKHMGARYNLARVAIDTGKLGDAARWLAEAYKIDKADVGVLELLCLLFEKKGMIDEAVKYCQKALGLNKKSKIARKVLAKYLVKLIDQLLDAGQCAEGLKQIENSGPLKSSIEMTLRRGVAYRCLGKFDKALTELLKYVNAKGNNARALRELGICYVNLKLINQAGTNFAKAAALEPENGINYAWLAYALEAKGELVKALEAWLQAAKYLKDTKQLKRAIRKIDYLKGKIGKDSKKTKEEDD